MPDLNINDCFFLFLAIYIGEMQINKISDIKFQILIPNPYLCALKTDLNTINSYLWPIPVK